MILVIFGDLRILSLPKKKKKCNDDSLRIVMQLTRGMGCTAKKRGEVSIRNGALSRRQWLRA